MNNPAVKTEINTLHDIKEVTKRTNQFIILATAIAASIIPIRSFYGHYSAALLLGIFCVFMTSMLVLNKKGF
ncbi:MAG TPA: hypothetical protein VHK69_17795, partial [Chitinophagaceae bacterium]|nr:hypothetical protein [Chitinophagaceae bacterium]